MRVDRGLGKGALARRRPPLIALLQALAQRRADLHLDALDAGTIRWALTTGVGPLLFQTIKADPAAPASPLWPLLHGADLTAHMLSEEQREALGELLAACHGRVPAVVLLMGISISDQHYPAPYLRPMRDIDFLVDAAAHSTVEALLHTLGYRQQSRSGLPRAFFDTYHHSMPFFHPSRGVWIEVHRGLFPPQSPLGMERIFRPEHLTAQLQPARFQGHPVARLSPELQLVYLAAHWAGGFHQIGGIIALVDTIFLLRNTQATLRWAQIEAWLHGSVVSAPLYLLLTYLTTNHLINLDPAVLETLRVRQRAFGTTNLRMLHRILDRYLVGGAAVGRVLRLPHLELLWRTLLLPGPPLRNWMRIGANIWLPARVRLGLSRLTHLLALRR